MDAFVKEATGHKCEKQELLNEMELLTQKLGELDDQLRLLKKKLDTYISPQAEADSIKDIPLNIADNAINNNLERIEYDVDQHILQVLL